MSKTSHCIHFTKGTCGPGVSSPVMATRLFFVLDPFLSMTENLGDSDTWRREPLMVWCQQIYQLVAMCWVLWDLLQIPSHSSLQHSGERVLWSTFYAWENWGPKSQETGSSSPRNEGQWHNTNSSPKIVGSKKGSSYPTPEKRKKKVSSHSCLQIACVEFLLHSRFFPKS